MAVTWRVILALTLMLAAGAIVYTLSRGRILFFPFVLILGLPLLALFKPPRR